MRNNASAQQVSLHSGVPPEVQPADNACTHIHICTENVAPPPPAQKDLKSARAQALLCLLTHNGRCAPHHRILSLCRLRKDFFLDSHRARISSLRKILCTIWKRRFDDKRATEVTSTRIDAAEQRAPAADHGIICSKPLPPRKAWPNSA